MTIPSLRNDLKNAASKSDLGTAINNAFKNKNWKQNYVNICQMTQSAVKK